MTKLKCYIVFCIILAVTHGNPSTNLLSTSSSTMNSSTANPTLPPSTNSSTQPTPTTPPEPTPKPTTKPTIKPTTKPTPQPTPNPTSPPPPVPVPDPTMGTWSLEYENSNRSCIVVDMAVQFEILSVNQTTKINLPINATSSGSCGANEDNVSLRWAENRNRLEFDFVELNNSRFQLDKISVKFVNLTIPRIGNKTYVLVHNKAEFSTPLANSYKCAKIQTLNLTEVDSNETVAYLHLSHVQFQAFSNISGHTFNSAVDCDGSLTTDVVPIVVGCVLAALVVMVLIAYLIGRRRCQARGYLSM